MSTVVISRGSKEIVFAGNLLKAPPLDRRGRKKWHQRYIILRANKTLECHKSQKAAMTLKPPRRVIDLRECISLELGLEYKDLQHVLCLGTFKRSFFFAAPSDAMMLQWSNVLENVKNAGEGETVEVLDIGLRKTQNYNAVHRVKPSASMQRLSTGSAKHLYLLGVPKSTSNLTNIVPDAQGSPRSTSGEEVVPDPPPRTSSLRHSSTSSTGSLPRGSTPERTSRLVKLDNHGSPGPNAMPLTLDLRGTSHTLPSPTANSVFSPGRDRSRSVCSNHNTSNPTTPTGKFLLFPARVPPPSLGAMVTRENNLKEQTEERAAGQDHVTVVDDHVAMAVDHATTSGPGMGSLPHRAGSREKVKLQTESNNVPQPAIKQSEATAESVPTEGQGPVDSFSTSSKLLQRVNAFKKRSTPKLDGPNASVVLQSNMKASFRYKKIPMRPEEPIFTKEEGGDSSDEDTESQTSGDQGGVVIDEVHLKKVGPNFEAKMSGSYSAHKVVSGSCEKVRYRVRANSYSKVTMTAVSQEVNRCYPQRVNAPTSPSASSPAGNVEEDGQGDAGGYSSPRSPSPLVPQDMDLFPAPPSQRRTFCSTNSLNSLDAIDVEPPEMFKQTTPSGGGERSGEQTCGKDDAHTILDGGGDGDQAGDSDLTSSADRRSVESSDTGYTSGVSPAALHDVKEVPPLGRVGSKKIALGRALSGDGSKLYVPMVFSCPAVGKDRNLFAVQVCLVECSDSLIKDLVLFKALHSYQLVQCDEPEEVDTGSVSVADSFTVETSLEDLEFGFGVVSNTQKDMFDHRVREFHFEVRDLFKTTKSFTCDVWIKYAGRITKLPIEVQRTSGGQS